MNSVTVPHRDTVLLVVPTGLIAVSTFLVRPNILGELFNVEGVALCGAAGLITFLQRPTLKVHPTVASLTLILALAEAWEIFRSTFSGRLTIDLVRGEGLTLVAVGGALYALSETRTRKVFLQFVFLVIFLLSSSSAISDAMRLLGLQPPVLSHFQAGVYPASLTFPFTPEVGSLSVSGTTIPRLAGLGREPGWGAMYPAIALLAWPLVFRRRPLLISALLTWGTLAPLSTSGFGILLIGVAIQVVFGTATQSDQEHLPPTSGFRLVVGPLLLVAFTWTALYAPVFGLEAKQTQSAASLDARNAATTAGLNAISAGSLGRAVDLVSPDVNIIATAATSGWPYVVLITASLLVPAVMTPSVRRACGSIAVVLLTLLLAQPPAGSAFVWILFGALLLQATHSATGQNQFRGLQ